MSHSMQFFVVEQSFLKVENHIKKPMMENSMCPEKPKKC